MKVKVGPITAQYKGAASFVERDDVGHRAVLRAEGRDTRGAGNAAADITAQLEAVDGGTRVTVTTDLTVTGKVAQFGRGVMADVSRKLMGQFADNLSDLISTADSEPASDADPTPVDEPPSEVEAVRVVDGPEAEAIDLLGTAGAPVLKRLVSTLVVLAVVVVLVVWVLG